MNTQSTNIGINATSPHVTFSSNTLKGNIVHHQWYNTVLLKSGRPDLSTISLLSEAVYWNRPKNDKDASLSYNQPSMKFSGNAWQTSYAYLSKKFGFSYETIRRSLVKLENLGAVRREFRKVYLKGQTYNNVMFIHLGENIHKFLTPLSAPKSVFLTSEREYPSPHGCGHHIDNKIKEKEFISRSDESNFIESNLREEASSELSQNNLVENPVTNPHYDFDAKTLTTLEQTPITLPTTPEPANLLTKIKAKFTGNKRKTLLEFHPLTEEDAESLRLSSTREFNLDYINKLILKLSKDKPDHGFYTKKLFLKYMSKVLEHELREEGTVNRETFNFKADVETNRTEQYLKQIEESSLTDKVSQLKKKIAAVFEPKLAYGILTSIRLKEDITDNIFKITLLKACTISDHESKLLLGEVRAIFGDEISAIEFIDRKSTSPSADHAPETSEPDKLELNLGIEGSLWNKVSKRLLEYYGEGIHRSWFSKLEPVETVEHEDDGLLAVADTSVSSNASTRSLVLRAPSGFIRDWVQSNYLFSLREIISELQVTKVIKIV